METLVLNVASDPDAAVTTAAGILKRGGLVAFPTETVYGLGSLGLHPNALERIFQAKGRPLSDPMILHVAEPEWLGELVTAVPPTARKLVERFWPGPLTLVLPRSEKVPDLVTSGGDSVAVRMPAHPVALELIRRVGEPVAAPSANLFSRPSATTAEHVLQDLRGRIDAVLDAGPSDVGVESTVLDVRGAIPVVLRPGGITRDRLERVLGTAVASGPGPSEEPATSSPRPIAPSPGLLSRHYSPRAQVLLFDGAAEPVIGAMRRAAVELPSTAVLAFTEDTPRFRDLGVLLAALGPRERLDEVAKRLYALFRELDARGIQRIVLRTAPSGGLGDAINDRLRRAAGRVRQVDGVESL